MYTRQAILRVSRVLLESLLPKGKVIDTVSDKVGEVDYSWLKDCMNLPSNCKITGVTTYLYFIYDEIGIRIECEDFVKTSEGCVLPEIRTLCNENGFLQWEGDVYIGSNKTVESKIKFKEFL